jgi:low affinity Fe/Cu permease
MQDLFRRFAQSTSAAVGSAWAFAGALLAILIWAALGPSVGFSTTWQLVINTGTTIVTFLIVFLIQNTQNRESRAIQLKLDELILASSASNAALDLENLPDQRAKELLMQFQELALRIAGEDAGGGDADPAS